MSEPGPSATLLVISGPSGVGKTTLCGRLLQDDRIGFSVSATTRPAREGEVNGVDYHFLTPEAFAEGVAQGRFLEYAEVFGRRYGTLRSEVETVLADGRICLLDIDVAGARQVRDSGMPGRFVFILPPDEEALRRRIIERASEPTEEIEKRLARAERETACRGEYDHEVVNDDVDRAAAEILAILGIGRPAGK